MDYLVIEGYKDAAQRFSAETGLRPQIDLESIENRMTIRAAIQRGDVEDAISRVNELDPEVSFTDSLSSLRICSDDIYRSCTTLRSSDRCGFDLITNLIFSLSKHGQCYIVGAGHGPSVHRL